MGCENVKLFLREPQASTVPFDVHMNHTRQMKSAISSLSALLVIWVAQPLHGEILRLVGEDFLSVGNRWEYRLHITSHGELGPVDWWGFETWEIVSYETVAGRRTALLERKRVIENPLGGDGETLRLNWFFSEEPWREAFLGQARSEERTSDGEIEVQIELDGESIKLFPLFVKTSERSRYLGEGEYFGYVDDDDAWRGSLTTEAVYLGHEEIALASGMRFPCMGIRLDLTWWDWEVYRGPSFGTIGWSAWFHPEIGIVRSKWVDNDTHAVYTLIFELELLWANIASQHDRDRGNRGKP